MKRKFISFVATLASLALALCMATGCSLFAGSSSSSSSGGSSAPTPTASWTVEETTETYVVIKVEKAEANTMLLDVMESLQASGKMSYTLSGTMVQSINGKANAADWSASWLLYTSDVEMANNDWGTYEYKGATLGSAILGADALPVLAGATYIWVYTSF